MENQIEMYKAAYEGAQLNIATGQIALDPFYVLEIDREDMLNQTFEIIKKSKPGKRRIYSIVVLLFH